MWSDCIARENRDGLNTHLRERGKDSGSSIEKVGWRTAAEEAK